MTEEEKNNRLIELRSAYSKILEAKKIIAHMSLMCSSSIDTLVYMDRNAKIIQSISEHFTIPYYNEFFDNFTDYQKNEDYYQDIEKVSKACVEKLDKTGIYLESKQAEISSEIEKVKNTPTKYVQ